MQTAALPPLKHDAVLSPQDGHMAATVTPLSPILPPPHGFACHAGAILPLRCRRRFASGGATAHGESESVPQRPLGRHPGGPDPPHGQFANVTEMRKDAQRARACGGSAASLPSSVIPHDP